MKSFYLALAFLLTLPGFGQVTRKTFPYMDSGTAVNLPLTCPVPSFYMAADTFILYVCDGGIFIPVTSVVNGVVSAANYPGATWIDKAIAASAALSNSGTVAIPDSLA